MIPQRIFLSGFLSYREEQEVLLDGSSLWMMSGLNGSGKSSIFDGITYALFGYHRGGTQNAVELINHDCDRLVVELDFLLDQNLYQARRTLSRKPDGKASATQQIYRFHSPTSSEKEPISGTNRKTEFNEWVRDNIGLTYDTFTSSVLLLQGRAEKLLDSTAKGRFDVLAGIVDLDRFRRLHERADNRRKELKAKVETLEHQLEGMPEIGKEQLDEIEAKIKDAQEVLEKAQKEVERLQELQRRSKQWQDLEQRRKALEDRWKESQQLLTEAEDIEQALARLKELQSVLPPLEDVNKKRASIRELQRDAKKLSEEQTHLEEQSRKNAQSTKTTKKNLEELRKNLNDLEQQHQKVAQRLPELTGIMSKVAVWEEQNEELKAHRKRLADQKEDPEKAFRQAKEELEELTTLSQSLTVLHRFAQRRDELQLASENVLACAHHETKIAAMGKALREAHERLEREADEARAQRQKAENELSAARALRDQCEQMVKEFSTLEGAQLCRTCGQPLTPAHFEEEKAKREQEFAKAHRAFTAAKSGHESALVTEREAQELFRDGGRSLEKARDEYREAKGALSESEARIERQLVDCANAYDDLSPTYKQRVLTKPEAQARGIDEWLKTTWPQPTDLEKETKRVEGLSHVKENLERTEKQFEQWKELKAQAEATRKNLAKLEQSLPGEIDALREEHVRLQTEDRTLKATMQAQRKEEQRAQQEMEKLAQEKSKLQQREVEIKGRLTTSDSQRRLYEESIEQVRRSLSEVWREKVDEVDLSALNEWGMERDQLVRDRTEARAEQLREARVSLDSLKSQRRDLESEAEKFTEEERVSPETIHRDLTHAKEQQHQASQELQKANQDKSILEERRDQREKLRAELVQFEGEHNRFSLLSQLLGRDRLQRHLVRRAERQVVDHANAVLDRLSGGQLYLRLRGSDDGEATAEKALELEAYNRTTGQAPINVSFLSGSQRFRVAVSLALGLGQFASRRHRPIESVIIDEGFGCLDRQGRQVMIQELQNLRGQLRCILLVSHQEEFAEAFPDGYHFELDDGTTRVRRFEN